MQKSTDEMLALLEQVQTKQDYHKIASYYFELGKLYKEKGITTKALYYLGRFDNLVSGDDDLYDNFEKEDEQAMDWIEEIQTEQMPYELTIQQQVMEMSEDLTILQKMQWLLLSMARFCTLFEELSQLSGYDFYGYEKLSEMVDYFSEGLYGELSEDAEEALDDFYSTIEDVFDSSVMNDYNLKLQIPNQESFVPADLESGDVGTFYFTMAYDLLQAYIFDEEVDEEDLQEGIRFTACGILADYYYRTSETDIKGEPKIQEETKRIFGDYDFVKGNPDKESLIKRIEKYKKIMLV